MFPATRNQYLDDKYNLAINYCDPVERMTKQHLDRDDGWIGGGQMVA